MAPGFKPPLCKVEVEKATYLIVDHYGFLGCLGELAPTSARKVSELQMKCGKSG